MLLDAEQFLKAGNNIELVDGDVSVLVSYGKDGFQIHSTDINITPFARVVPTFQLALGMVMGSISVPNIEWYQFGVLGEKYLNWINPDTFIKAGHRLIHNPDDSDVWCETVAVVLWYDRAHYVVTYCQNDPTQTTEMITDHFGTAYNALRTFDMFGCHDNGCFRAGTL